MNFISGITLTQNPATSFGPERIDNLLPGDLVENSYSHEIRAMGGFWASKFKIANRKYGIQYFEDLLLTGLGRHVEVGDTQAKIAWEGKVTGLNLVLPGISYSVKLNNMSNRVWARYVATAAGQEIGATIQDYDAELVAKLDPELDGSNSVVRSTKQNNSDSQTRYGIKEKVLSGGLGSSTLVDQATQAYLDNFDNPAKPTILFSDSGQSQEMPVLEVECQGYFRTLDWRTYNQTALSLNDDISDIIAAVVTAAGEFIGSVEITANTSQASQVYDSDRTASAILLDLARRGDSSNNRYVLGVYEERKLIYEPIDITGRDNITYFTQALSNDRNIRTQNGRVVGYPEIRPGKFLMVEDMMGISPANYDTITEDPQVTFIESVVYQEPFGLTLYGARADMLDVILGRAGLGGVSTI